MSIWMQNSWKLHKSHLDDRSGPWFWLISFQFMQWKVFCSMFRFLTFHDAGITTCSPWKEKLAVIGGFSCPNYLPGYLNFHCDLCRTATILSNKYKLQFWFKNLINLCKSLNKQFGIIQNILSSSFVIESATMVLQMSFATEECCKNSTSEK